MASHHFEEHSFETKLDSLKDEFFHSGLSPDTFVNLDKLLEILGTRVHDRQQTRDLLVSIANSIGKNSIQDFKLSQFFEGCAVFKGNAQLKTENAQIHLAKLQNEKAEIAEALMHIRPTNPKDPAGASRHGMLTLEINGLQGVKVPHAKPIYIKVICYNTSYKTAAQPYSEQVFWHDKFTFELLTGFDRVDVQVISSDMYGDEYIGESQIHVSNIKDKGYHKEWTSVYGKNYSQVGSILLGMQIMASKSEYLKKVLEKLEEHIKLQIQEIEESEKKLRNLNILIGYPGSPSHHAKERLSHKAKSSSPGNPVYQGAEILKNKYFDAVLDDDDAKSMITTTEVGDIKMPDFSKFPQGVKNYETDRFENNNIASIQFNDHKHREFEKRSKTLQNKEIEAQERNSSKNGQHLTQYSISRDSQGINSLAETRSNSQSPFRNTVTIRKDSSDKDSVINYLQKSLNDSTFENQKLNKIIDELEQEKQLLFVKETLQAKEYRKKMQEYETRIFGLVSEIERLDKLANKKGNTYDYPPVVSNINLEKSMKQLQEENVKLTQSLAKKSQEIDMLKIQLKEEREWNRENAKPNIRAPEDNFTRGGRSESPPKKRFQLNDSDPYIPGRISPNNAGHSYTVKTGKKLSLFPSLPFH